MKRFFYSLLGLRLRGRQADNPEVMPLKEDDAYPAMPEDGYGWEKLFSERMCRTSARTSAWRRASRASTTSTVRTAPGTAAAGKAPAAICRKVVEAKHSGDARDRDLGRRPPDPQLHVHRRLHQGYAAHLLDSDIPEPINLGIERARDDQPARRHCRGRSPASS